MTITSGTIWLVLGALGLLLLAGAIAGAALFWPAGVIFGALLLAYLAAVLLGALVVVQQQEVGVLQTWGKFNRLLEPGLHFKTPIMDRVSGRVSLRVQQLDVRVETKTEDNVFAVIVVAVQYFVLPERVYDAFYRLQSHGTQITAFVYDVVRARVPRMTLDSVFDRKDEIADAVKAELEQMMAGFGYGILKALVTDIEPDGKVKDAMNEINAAQRLRVAASEKGEAERILKVKQAEAEAQSKALQGQGIADQRRAIVEGLRESVGEFQQSVKGASSQEVLNLILLTQYFDTLKELGQNGHTHTIMLPHSPGALGDLASQIREAIIAGNAVKG
ncbi:SPFH domain-containing protein [bacterium]|nr:MAG: SPFH domain-containing protein [bacterium]RIK63066.1 MAG: SPFH domain-containing protein [Planctomycetota bacterium]